jgi:hypothetical protein
MLAERLQLAVARRIRRRHFAAVVQCVRIRTRASVPRASVNAGLSRRRSRVLVPSLPVKVPANRHIVSSGRTRKSGRLHKRAFGWGRNGRKPTETLPGSRVDKPFLVASRPTAKPACATEMAGGQGSPSDAVESSRSHLSRESGRAIIDGYPPARGVLAVRRDQTSRTEAGKLSRPGFPA